MQQFIDVFLYPGQHSYVILVCFSVPITFVLICRIALKSNLVFVHISVFKRSSRQCISGLENSERTRGVLFITGTNTIVSLAQT